MAEPLADILADEPVVASVKNAEDLDVVLRSECRVVFLLYGTLLDLPDLVRTLKDAGRIVLVNVDLLDGFAAKDVTVRFIAERTAADGILSSKASLVRAARECGLLSVHRFFLIDSISYRNLVPQLRSSQAECVEILPGCVPRVISWVVDDIDVPLIAGGLVCDRDDVYAALKAGAAAVASSNHDIWSM
ncbi:glycerol-3-phosphate responsive antiterminator [Spiractinospora alimapuensis]|uniref:glycerol-3-phosphate responsive antiterminator n=1 Tax=Spiractinospora alimapuensis TaxID=2820884 RepID=UPI001F24E24A|nr:glycerol-3-phosphate responsive antiterminator [Spiractinospora alimapuensis]QVQ53423.1 glycerol-3-phosphate responsive antiterminator [Spiractinospora alimapuensis]